MAQRNPLKTAIDASAQQRVGVIVQLDRAADDDDCRKRLQALGLEVRQTVKDKLIGAIDTARLPALEADPAVAEVETSRPLQPRAH